MTVSGNGHRPVLAVTSYQANELDRLNYRWPGAVHLVETTLAGALVVTVNGQEVVIPRNPGSTEA